MSWQFLLVQVRLDKKAKRRWRDSLPLLNLRSSRRKHSRRQRQSCNKKVKSCVDPGSSKLVISMFQDMGLWHIRLHTITRACTTHARTLSVLFAEEITRNVEFKWESSSRWAPGHRRVVCILLQSAANISQVQVRAGTTAGAWTRQGRCLNADRQAT